MGKAISQIQRAKIIEHYLCQENYGAISTLVGVSISGCKKIISAWKLSGHKNIPINQYNAYGKKGVKFPKIIYESAIKYKEEHPLWGSVLIQAKLREHFCEERLPSIRSINNWFSKAIPQKKRSCVPKASSFPPRATRLHQIWQVDYKSLF